MFFFTAGTSVHRSKNRSEGISATTEMLDALLKAPAPQLQSFLGVVNFFGKFLPNLVTVEQPFFVLLRKNTL